MPVLALPQIVAGRDFADQVIDKLGSLSGQDVVIDARDLVSGTPSFAAQVVERVLGPDGATTLKVLGAPPEFVLYMQRAADLLSVTDRLSVVADDDADSVPAG